MKIESRWGMGSILVSFLPMLQPLGHIPCLPSCPEPRLTLSTWPLAERWLRGGERHLSCRGQWTPQALEPRGPAELATEESGLDFSSLVEDTRGISENGFFPSWEGDLGVT